jgi:hypothetical protein
MTPLFETNEVVPCQRLRLSALDPGLIETMPWLDAALAPDWTVDELSAALGRHEGVLISDADAAPIGVAVVDVESLEGAISVPFLGIDPARRFRGLGGEAGLAIERHLRARLGSERFFAPIPDGRGLAVYFWLRLGYRPLLASESPGPLVGLTADPPSGIWMLRDTP